MSTAWMVVLFAAGGTLLADLQIFAFGSLLPAIQSELALSQTSAGLLAGMSLAALALLRIPAGILIDRRGARLGLALGLTAMGAGSLTRGMAHGPAVLGVGQLLVGYGIAQAVVAGPVLVNQALPKKVIGRGMGLLNAGFGIGALVGSVMTPRLAQGGGWRWPLWLYGALGLVLAGLWVRLGPASDRTRAGMGSITVLRHPRLWLLALQMALVFGSYVGLATWLPTAARDTAASSMLWAWPVGYLAGAVVGGLLADHPRSRWLMWMGPFIAGGSVVALTEMRLPFPAALAVAIAVAVTFVIRDALVAGWFAPDILGLVFGTITAVGALGATIGTVMIGNALDRGSGFGVAFAGLGGALALAALVGGAALVSGRGPVAED